MTHSTRAHCTVAAAVAIALLSEPASGGQRDSGAAQGGDKRPSVALRATPLVGFTPLRVHVVVELRGGPNDYSDFYCPTVEWDWGDGTISENSEDCDPYEVGRSIIRRRFAADHTYRQADSYRLAFRIKQKTKVLAQATAAVQVRPGARDNIDN